VAPSWVSVVQDPADANLSPPPTASSTNETTADFIILYEGCMNVGLHAHAVVGSSTGHLDILIPSCLPASPSANVALAVK
jgi:hypothetical protein